MLRFITLCLVTLTAVPSVAAAPTQVVSTIEGPRAPQGVEADTVEKIAGPDAAARLAVEEQVTAQVKRALPAQMSLGRVQVAGALPWPTGAVLTVKWPSAARVGAMSVLVSVRDASREIGRTWARLEIRQTVRVVVARRALTRGGTLTAADIAVEERPSSSTTKPEVEADALLRSLIGLPLLHDVAAGQLLSSADADLPAPAAAGASVKVVVRRRGLSISTAGVLERPLRPGEIGRARLITGHRVVTGRLIDPGTLIVDSLGDALAGNLGDQAP